MSFDAFALTGPEFLRLYVVCLAAITFYRYVRRKHWHASQGSVPTLKWTPYELACLAGGHRRVGEVALLELLRKDVLSLAHDGDTLTAGKIQPTGLEEPERVMHAMVGNGHASLRRLCDSFFALDSVTRRLRSQGLVARDDLRATMPFDSRFGALPLFLLLVLGICRLVNGVSHGRPVVFLILLCMLSFIMLCVWLGRRDMRTHKGTQLLVEQSKRNAALRTTAKRRGAALSHNDFVLAAGLFGPAVVLNGELAVFRPAFAPQTDSGGSGSSCGSGGSCGSSCGGGGCGGCGG